MAPLGAAGECVPAHTYETVKNHSQTRKFPTKGSQGTWKWIFFPDQEAQTDNIQFAEKSFYSFEPYFAANMVKFMMPLEWNASLDLAGMLNCIEYRKEGEKAVVSIHPLNILQLWTGRKQRNNKPCWCSVSGFRLPNFNIFTWCKTCSTESAIFKEMHGIYFPPYTNY